MADDLEQFLMTLEIFPSLVFVPDKLACEVEEIRAKQEATIRATVLEILDDTCPAETEPAV